MGRSWATWRGELLIRRRDSEPLLHLCNVPIGTGEVFNPPQTPCYVGGIAGRAVVKRTFWFTVALTLLGGQGTARAGIVYDSETGAALGFTGSTPRTFMGQGFTVADPGGPVEITSMSLVLVAATAVNYAATRINVEFWDNF